MASDERSNRTRGSDRDGLDRLTTYSSAPGAGASMRCVCGWCNGEIRAGHEPVTTGICVRCLAELYSERVGGKA